MNIIVCVNHVPDTASKILVGQDAKSIDETSLTFVLNPYDEYSIEEALITKEKFGGEVTAISVGKEGNLESIKKALAMGCDNAVLLKTEEEMDSFGVASALAEEIKNRNADLVFLGKQSVDYDNMVVGPMLSELLGFNSVSIVSKMEIDDRNVKAERDIEGGKEIVTTLLPVVITTQKGINEPRYPTLKGIMGAKKKPIEVKEIYAPNKLVEVLNIKLPAEKQPGKIIGTDVSSVPELIRLLKEEAKVI